MTDIEIINKAWRLRKQTQGNIFVCYAAIITNADNPKQYVRTTKPKEALDIFRKWKNEQKNKKQT